MLICVLKIPAASVGEESHFVLSMAHSSQYVNLPILVRGSAGLITTLHFEKLAHTWVVFFTEETWVMEKASRIQRSSRS